MDKQKIYNLFLQGMSIQDISTIYQMKKSSIYQIIDGRLTNTRAFSQEQIRDVVNMYKNGNSSSTIGLKYRVCHKQINKILDDFNIPRKHNGVRKWSINQKYFDVIDTANKAYILGMLYSDGFNDVKKSTIRLSLQSIDKKILQDIRSEIESQKPLIFNECSHYVHKNGYISKDMYTLEFYSSHMSKRLDDLGVKQNKSLILKFPSFLQDDLKKDFIRGYFDGDGSLYVNNNGQSAITITSTEQFCIDCLNVLRSQLHIGGGIYDASCHNGITKVISISGNIQCKKVLDYIYQDSKLKLERKYQRYLNKFYL